jgi:hypothetical protein
MDNEFSELQAIDFSLGAYIMEAFEGLNPNTGPKQWREFLTRAVNKKIFREETDTPAEFLKNLSSSGKTETVVDGVKLRLPQLPVTYYYRKPGMTNGDTRNFPKKIVTNGTKLFDITMSPLVLDYHIVFAAWDKLSIDKMQIAWYQYVIKKTRFTIQYEIAGEAFDVSAAVRDPYTIMFSDISIPKTEGRLFAVDTLLTIETSVLFGAELSPALYPNQITLEGSWGGFANCDKSIGERCSG